MSSTATNKIQSIASAEAPLTLPSPRWGEDEDAQSNMFYRLASPSFRIPHSAFRIALLPFRIALLPFRIAPLTFRNPKSAIRNSSGFTYIALLAAIVIIGITLGSAAKSWQNVAQREKEEELLFRGNQYRIAIESYYNYQGRHQYPNTIDVLLKDERSINGKRHLRQQYKDPMTGEDFEVVRDMFHGDAIKGVFSKSDKTPLKQTGFPEELKDFEGKTRYSEWQFIKEPTAVTPAGMGPGRRSPGTTNITQ
jgi:type II secretory pathway pseudopilin PulG